MRFESATSFEGDEIHGTIELIRPRGMITTISVDNRPGWSAVDPEPALIWTIGPSGDKVIAPFTVRAETWGKHRLGAVNIVAAPAVRRHRVGERPRRVADVQRPAQPGAPSPAAPPAGLAVHRRGAHLPARRRRLRLRRAAPVRSGDRLRDVNWRASARFDQLQTNRRHPDRSGEVVLLLDTFADGVGTASVTAQAALTRAARAAWSVAQLHLDVQDRVGLAAQGRVVTQLRPRSGDRARYDLLNTLLSIGGLVTAGESAHGRQPLSRLPANALILAFTPADRPALRRRPARPAPRRPSGDGGPDRPRRPLPPARRRPPTSSPAGCSPSPSTSGATTSCRRRAARPVDRRRRPRRDRRQPQPAAPPGRAGRAEVAR